MSNSPAEIPTLARVFEVLVLRLGGAGLAILVAFFGSRYLGSEQVGLLLYALGLVNIIIPVFSLGLPQLMLRRAATTNSAVFYNVALLKALGLIVVSAAVAYVIISIGQAQLVQLLQIPGLQALFPSLTVIFFCSLVISLLTFSLQGRGFVRISAAIHPVIINTLTCMAFILYSPSTALEQITYIAWINTIITFALLVFSALLFIKKHGHRQGDEFEIPLRLRDGRYFWYNNMFRILSMQLPVIILGAMVPSAYFAYFSYASRCATIVSLGLVSITNVTAPRIARLHSEGEHVALEKLAKWTVKASTLMAAPLILLAFVFAEPLLAIFGPDFVKGSLAMRVLLLAELVNVCCGPVGYLLSLTGNEKAIFRINTLAGILVIVACPLVVRYFGITGASFLLFARMCITNVAGSLIVKKRLGFIPAKVWKQEIRIQPTS